MKFEWIRDWDIIWSEAFLEDWNSWIDVSENAHVFFHPAMVKAWVDTYRPIRDIEPLFCVAKENDTVIFLPLILWKKNWKNAFLHTIVPVGFSDYDYHDPIVVTKEEQDLQTFWKQLLIEIPTLPNLNFDSLVTDDITINIKHTSLNCISSQQCPFILIKEFENLNNYMSYLKKNTRKTLNRAIRELENLGELKYSTLSYNEAINQLPHMLKVHSKRYKNAYKAPNFHKNLLDIMTKNDLVHISALSINDEVFSWRIGFVFKNTYYSYMPIFETKYEKYSPSKVHLLFNIQEFIEFNNSVVIYDLMRGAKTYKNSFANGEKEVFTYNLQNSQLSSKVKLLLNAFKEKIRG